MEMFEKVKNYFWFVDYWKRFVVAIFYLFIHKLKEKVDMM